MDALGLTQELACPSRQPTAATATTSASTSTGARRYFAIQASAGLAKLRDGLGADLRQFESAALGTRINRRLYQEAEALYSRCGGGGGGWGGGWGWRGELLRGRLGGLACRIG
jgi:hypothetical protein